MFGLKMCLKTNETTASTQKLRLGAFTQIKQCLNPKFKVGFKMFYKSSELMTSTQKWRLDLKCLQNQMKRWPELKETFEIKRKGLPQPKSEGWA